MGGASSSGGPDSAADAPPKAAEVGVDAASAASSEWPSRVGLIAAAMVAVSAVVSMLIVVSGPRPAATLERTAEAAPVDVIVLVRSQPRFAIDPSTLRRHESFEGWDVWSGSNVYGSSCVVAIAPTDDFVRVQCSPPPAQPVADTFPYSLREAGIIRFILDGDTVDAWVYPLSGPD